MTTCRLEILVPVPQVNVQGPQGDQGLSWHGPNRVGAAFGVGFSAGWTLKPKLGGLEVADFFVI